MAVDVPDGRPAEDQGGAGGEVTVVIPVQGMTCSGCTRRVQAALRVVPGTLDAQVELSTGQAIVGYDPTRVTVDALRDAIEAAGYGAGEPESPLSPVASGQARETSSRPSATAGLGVPILFGVLGSAALLGFYLGVVTLAQGFEHAAELLQQDRFLVGPIILGFGVQVGLFSYMRRQLHRSSGSARALTGAGAGTSSVAMLACCTHHLADVLPVLGISGAALFLSEYRQPLMLVGLATNVAGIVFMVRMIRRVRACAI